MDPYEAFLSAFMDCDRTSTGLLRLFLNIVAEKPVMGLVLLPAAG